MRKAVAEAMKTFGNPSSIHAEGRAARAMIESARRGVTAAIGAGSRGALIFTSGATEANGTALREGPVLASAVEHPSVLAQPGIRTIPVDAEGRLDLKELQARLAEDGVAVLAVMLANNETGVIQPVAEAAKLAHEAGVMVHVDAVQALGKLAIDVDALGVDSLALSAHKIGGPKGIGALWLRHPDNFTPWLRGGGQEGRRRAGTESTAAIAGFAAALEALSDEEGCRLERLRGALEDGAAAIAGDIQVVASGAPRAPHVTALALPGLQASTQVMALDLAGVAVSAGAACSSGKVATSQVLTAMGLDRALAASTIRVSLGWSTTPADVAGFLERYATLAERRWRTAS